MPIIISGFTPTQGPVGTQVSLSITGLPVNAGPDNVFVFLSGDPTVSVDSVDVSTGTVVVTIETNAQGGEFVVACEGEGAPGPGVFTVTSGANDEPHILTMAPRGAQAGGRIMLRGENLQHVQSIVIGVVPAVISTHTDSSIAFTVPMSLQPGSYRVYGMSHRYGRVNCPYMLTVAAGPDEQ